MNRNQITDPSNISVCAAKIVFIGEDGCLLESVEIISLINHIVWFMVLSNLSLISHSFDQCIQNAGTTIFEMHKPVIVLSGADARAQKRHYFNTQNLAS